MEFDLPSDRMEPKPESPPCPSKERRDKDGALARQFITRERAMRPTLRYVQISRMTVIKTPTPTLLFRLRQLRNNCGNFVEYLVPALHLTAIFRALHGFISNEGKFRLAVSEILKEGHVVRTVDSLMFYS